VLNQTYGNIRPTQTQYVTGFPHLRKFPYNQGQPVYSIKNPLYQPTIVNPQYPYMNYGYPMMTQPVVINIVQPINSQMIKRITPTEPDNTSHYFSFPTNTTPTKK